MTCRGSYLPRKKITLECFACGNKFEATRADARYCSSMCRQQISRAMRACATVRKSLVSTNAPKAAKKLAAHKPKRN